jgi:serine/threonine-protein kinase SRPK3
LLGKANRHADVRCLRRRINITNLKSDYQRSTGLDMMSPPRYVYYLVDDVEDVERYAPPESSDEGCIGNYCPILIGDIIQPFPQGNNSDTSMYCILHKLGFGSNSTVWLARDIDRNKLVALKIMVADATSVCLDHGHALGREVQIHSKLAHSVAINSDKLDIVGKELILPLLNHFLIQSPNGFHYCLVTEPCGPSIGLIRYEYQKLPPSLSSRSLAVQLAQVISYIHSQGIVHGGACPCLSSRFLETPSNGTSRPLYRKPSTRDPRHVRLVR